MKRFLLFTLLFGMALCMTAQTYTIKGFVRDTTGIGVEFATVAFMRVDSSVVSGAIAGEDGGWVIEGLSSGRYLVRASMVGYDNVFKTIEVKGNMDNITFTLREEGIMLGEVEVTAKRPMIERSVDKIVMNVAESPFAIGNSTTDILKKAPGVVIDKDGNVTVNGKSVEVYINGKPSYLSGDQLRALLQGTDGSLIDKIEIITNPSSKYDAAGQGGIIDIKLKRNMSGGLNGSLAANYGGMYFKDIDRYVQRDYVSLNLNYKGKNTYTSVSLSQGYGEFDMMLGNHTKSEQAGHTIEMNTFSKPFETAYQSYQFRLTNDWMVDDKNTIGFILQVPVFVENSGIKKGNNWSNVLIDGTEVERFETENKDNMLFRQHTANVNYTHVFAEQLARELTFNFDYSRNNRGQRQEQNTDNKYTMIPTGINIDSRQIVNIYSAKADFQTMFWKTGMIECGAKWSMANTNSNMTTDSLLNNAPLSSTPQDFVFTEHIAALYISAAKQFDEHWSAKLGLRGELTYNKGEWLSSGKVTESKPYFNLFPTVFLGYNPTEKWNTALSYTRRIQRPGYSQLNPFVTYYDAHSSIEGNPELKPSFSHNVSLSGGYSQYVSLEFDFSTSNDVISMQSYILENGDMRIKEENFGRMTSHSINLSLTELPLVHIKKTDMTWLTLTLNLGGAHFINRSGDFCVKQFYGSVYGSLAAHLPKDWKLYLDGYYSSPFAYTNMKIEGNFQMNFAVKKYMLQKTLALTLRIDDIFRTFDDNIEMLNLPEGQENKIEQKYYAQSLSLSLTYSFGQYQAHKYRKVGNLEESSRSGSGGGGGGIGR